MLNITRTYSLHKVSFAICPKPLRPENSNLLCFPGTDLADAHHLWPKNSCPQTLDSKWHQFLPLKANPKLCLHVNQETKTPSLAQNEKINLAKHRLGSNTLQPKQPRCGTGSLTDKFPPPSLKIKAQTERHRTSASASRVWNHAREQTHPQDSPGAQSPLWQTIAHHSGLRFWKQPPWFPVTHKTFWDTHLRRSENFVVGKTGRNAGAYAGHNQS